jgi:hypothetical protein
MANTVIQLKKSATPSATPTDLANGELAINYADGKLFYKAANGTITSISGEGSNFGIVNANGTLIVSDTTGDVISILPGDNITIVGDAINDRLIINADLTAANSWANTKLANTTTTLAGSLTTTGTVTANGYVYITPVGGEEGGEIQLQSTGSNVSWSIDSYQNNFRVFARSGTTVSNLNFFHATGGSIRLGVNKTDPNYAVDVSGDVNISGTYRVNGTPIAAGSSDLTPANSYTNTSTTAANNYAGAMANAANAYAASLTPDLSPVFIVANGAYDKANAANVLAYNTGIGANAYANVIGSSANNYAGAMANAVNSYTSITYSTLTQLGQNWAVTNAAYTSTNANYVVTNAAFTQSNTDNVRLSAAFVLLNAAFTVANAAYGNANSIAISANNYAGFMANSGNVWTQSIVDANLITARAYTNTSTTAANNYAGAMANSSNNYANNTFIKLTAPSQILTGSLEITGNLILSGNATSISTDNLSVQDPLIFLAANNISDIVDIGLVGHYNNGSANVHTGIYRDHASKEYFLFNGLSGEPQLVNDIVPYANNMVNAVLNSDVRTSNLNLGGANAIVWIRTAFDTVNAAYTSSNADYVLTNAAFNSVNSVATSANNYAGFMANSVNAWATATFATITNATAAFAAANAKVASVSGTSGRITSSGGTTPTIDLATAGAGAATYSSGVSSITVDAYGRVTSVTGSAGYVTSSGVTSVVAGTGLSGGTITSTGTISMPDVGPGATTAVSGISSITLDAQGRVTAVTGSAGYITGVSPTFSGTSIFTGTVSMRAAIANYLLIDAANIDWNLNTGQVATVTLGGNRTMNAPTNLRVGTFILHVLQDGAGGRTLTWNSVFKWPAGVAPVLTTTANRRDIFSFVCDGTNLYGSFLPDVR